MSTTQHPGAWRLGRLVGVDVLIRPSLLIMGAILVALFAQRFDDRTDSNPYVLATAFVLALYVSVLIHELAHVAVARRFRMRVHSVTLHLLGGETVIEGESRRPGQELAISIAGPLSSLAIGLACFAVEPALSGTPADPARARDTGGSCLGLAIADQIVRSHGGRIEVTSAVGNGSTFRVCLPFATASDCPLRRDNPETINAV